MPRWVRRMRSSRRCWRSGPRRLRARPYRCQERRLAQTTGVHTPNTTTHRLRFDDLQTQMVGGAKTAVLVLQGAVVLVLLIACANVANLQLARAESRHKELRCALRLGRGRGRSCGRS